MRKALAVLLALSMLSVSIPVLAEEEAAVATEEEAVTAEEEAAATEEETAAAEEEAAAAGEEAVAADEDAASAAGTWYMVVFGLTAGTFELKEDGTFTLEVPANQEAQNQEGTWSQEGEKVSLTVNGEPALFVFDGSELALDGDNIETLGLDIDGIELDSAQISKIIRISREPGSVTQAEMNAYQEDGTLPEGKTKEDMEAASDELVTGFLLLLMNMGDEEAE